MDSGSGSDMDRERADSGEFVLTVMPDRVLTVFEIVEGPVVTSSDGADESTERRRSPAGVGAKINVSPAESASYCRT